MALTVAAVISQGYTTTELDLNGGGVWATKPSGLLQPRSMPVGSTPVTAGHLTPLLAEAADPNTSATRLAEIAYQHPNARRFVAGNPNAYPGLVDWLRELNDPQVAQALETRADHD